MPANAGDMGLILESGRAPGGENGNPLQYSCWEIPWTESLALKILALLSNKISKIYIYFLFFQINPLVSSFIILFLLK